MAIDAVRQLKHRDALLTERRAYEDTWQEIAEFIFPRRLLALGPRNPGEQLNEEMLDSTAGFSMGVLVSMLQSGLTNPAQKWLGLRLPDEGLNAEDEVRIRLEDSSLRMLNAYKLSNLTPEFGELYSDLVAMGIGATFQGEADEDAPKLIGNFRGFRFQTYPVGTFVITEDAFGRVNGIYVVMTTSAEAAAIRWGPEKLSTDLQKQLTNKPHEPVWIVHGVLDKKLVPGAETPLPWASMWLELKSKHRIEEGGFEEFPYLVPRWSKSSGEIYASGVGHIALPDVKGLNKLIELKLKALAMAVLPPHMAKLQSVIGAVDFGPGGLTIVRHMDELKALESRADFRTASLEAEEWRSSIRRTFFVDQLLQLMSRDTPQMTATEVQVKLQLLQQVLGPAFNRLNDELLRPLVRRGVGIMTRKGALPGISELTEELDLDASDIQVEFEGPLARGQRGQELLAIERTVIAAQNMEAIRPGAMDNIDIDEVVRLTQLISGAPTTILRAEEARDTERKKREDTESAAAAAEIGKTGSEAVKNIAPLLEEGRQRIEGVNG